jgi:hypothetical protein
MSDHPLPSDVHTGSVVRQLKLLILLLLISNIALGGFGFYLLRAIDRNYSLLINRSVPILNGLQTVTARATEAMRSTNPNLLTETKIPSAEVAVRARVAMERDQTVRNNVLSRNWVENAEALREKIREAGQTFDRAAADVISILETNDVAGANQKRETDLRPAYNRYVDATTEAAELLQNKSLETSDGLSVQTANFSKVMLSLGTWPMIILGIFLLFTAVFVISVLIKVKLFSGQAA